MTSHNIQEFKKTFCDDISLAAFTMVQSYGSVLVIDRSNFAIIQYSENVVDLLNITNVSLKDKLITDFLTLEEETDDRLNWLATADKCYRQFIWKGKDSPISVWVYIHQQSNLILLEIELAENDGFDKQRISIIEKIINLKPDSDSTNTEKYAEQLCKTLVDITGCDRSILYRFESDDSGLVIGESTEKMDSYLGLRFPATDIPKNIRAMYLRQPIRYIPDIDAPPIALIPKSAEKIDLSQVMLRAVSPVHLEYLRNMDVASAISVSIINNNTLWGLVVCHYNKARTIPLSCRFGVMLLSKIIGTELISIDKIMKIKAEKEILHGVQQIQNIIYNESTVVSAFAKIHKDILKLFSADGLVYFYNDKASIVGLTPNEEQINNLIEWLQVYHNGEPFATDNLSQDYTPSINFTSHSCGLLAVPSVSSKHFLLFFRNEQIYEVSWGGDPHNVLTAHGEDYSPRKSFSEWQEQVHGHSIKWETSEINAAKALIQTFTIKQLQGMS